MQLEKQKSDAAKKFDSHEVLEPKTAKRDQIWPFLKSVYISTSYRPKLVKPVSFASYGSPLSC